MNPVQKMQINNTISQKEKDKMQTAKQKKENNNIDQKKNEQVKENNIGIILKSCNINTAINCTSTIIAIAVIMLMK